jgi:hypothetical protein
MTLQVVINLKTKMDKFKRERDQEVTFIAHFEDSFELEKTADAAVVLRQLSNLREKLGQDHCAQSRYRKLQQSSDETQLQLSEAHDLEIISDGRCMRRPKPKSEEQLSRVKWRGRSR